LGLVNQMQGEEVSSSPWLFLASTSVAYSVHPPTWFLSQHRDQLLPDWAANRYPIGSLLILLQQSSMPLLRKTKAAEAEKAKLRHQFLSFGQVLVEQLQSLDCGAEVFDPCNGLPTHSRSGAIHLDDLALIHAVLGYPRCRQGRCWVMEHPQWGKAVYPSVIVSTASPTQLQRFLQQRIRHAQKTEKTG
jgi:hypothetical protein